MALGERFARAISAGLFPGEGAQLAFESRDPFINQAFARGIELWGHQQMQSAANLFDMVCQHEPGSLVAQLWRVRALTTLDQRAAVEAHGQALLAQAGDRGDVRLQVMTHLCIGMAQLSDGRPELAGENYTRAQALARDLPDEWIGRVQVQLALLAHSRHQVEQARRCYLAADAALRAARSPLQLGQIQLHLGLLDEMEGDLISALERAEAALAQLEAQRRHAYAAGAHALLVNVHAALGRLDHACGMVDALLARLHTLQYADVVTYGTTTVVRVFSEFGDAAGMQRAAELGERLTGKHPNPRAAGPRWEAACHLALWRGDLAAMRATVAQAVQAPHQHDEALMSMLMLQLRAETAAGCFDAAAAVRERMAAHPLAAVQVEVRAVMERARAAELLARGDGAGALSTLLALVDRTSLGREHARARIDAAWLLAEAGDTERAAAMLSGAANWRNEHPAGLAAQARKAHAQGHAEKARECQQRALDRFRGAAPAVHQALLQAYAAPACTDPSAPMSVPRLARLATDSWLPDLR